MSHKGHKVLQAGRILTLTDDHISCGCCRGPEEDRCCCWNHQDLRYGIRPKVCSRHMASSVQDSLTVPNVFLQSGSKGVA